MSHITKEQLTHLAKLCRINLSTDDEQKLFSQLENILSFVSQLEEVDVSDVILDNHIGKHIDEISHVGYEQSGFTKNFLKNVQHPIKENALVITGKLSEHDRV